MSTLGVSRKTSIQLLCGVIGARCHNPCFRLLLMRPGRVAGLQLKAGSIDSLFRTCGWLAGVPKRPKMVPDGCNIPDNKPWHARYGRL